MSQLRRLVVHLGLDHVDNDYKIPHMGKQVLLWIGTLPICVNAPANACVIAREILGELDGEFEDNDNSQNAVKGE